MPPPRRYRDFGDDHERAHRRPRSGGNSGLYTGLIIGVVALCLLVVFGGLGLYMLVKGDRQRDALKAEMQREKDRRVREENAGAELAKNAANNFMNEIANARSDSAYRMTTADFKKRTSLEEFRALLAKHAKNLDGPGGFLADFDAPPNAVSYAFEKRSFDLRDWHTIKVIVANEGGEWKVDRFSVDRDEE